MQKVLEKVKKSPGKSWNSKFFLVGTIKTIIWDRLQNSILILGKLSELINFYSPGNHQKSYCFLEIPGGVRVY